MVFTWWELPQYVSKIPSLYNTLVHVQNTMVLPFPISQKTAVLPLYMPKKYMVLPCYNVQDTIVLL